MLNSEQQFVADTASSRLIASDYLLQRINWDDEDVSDDVKRNWFSEKGYTVAQVSLDDAVNTFMDSLSFWKGEYTLWVNNSYYLMVVSDDSININGVAIFNYDYDPENFKVTWEGGELTFQVAENEAKSFRHAKVVRGTLKYSIFGDIAGDCIGATLTALDAVDNKSIFNAIRLRQNALEYFNGTYLVALYNEIDSKFEQVHLEVKSTNNNTKIKINGEETSVTNEYINAFEQGKYGRWGFTGLFIYIESQKKYLLLEFGLSLQVDSAQKRNSKIDRLIKGTYTSDLDKISKINFCAVEKKEDQEDSDSSQSEWDKSTIVNLAFLIVGGIIAGGSTAVAILSLLRERRVDSKVEKKLKEMNAQSLVDTNTGIEMTRVMEIQYNASPLTPESRADMWNDIAKQEIEIKINEGLREAAETAAKDAYAEVKRENPSFNDAQLRDLLEAELRFKSYRDLERDIADKKTDNEIKRKRLEQQRTKEMHERFVRRTPI
ncbi:hypothetical protein [Acinetobacter sp. ANC 3832]|uniref:hypothetical protein n=1 Tax=Acinetobacter sp. ANC 3832 TaxID=1977874 RepID=UPI000A34262A|nr:hypothetical protein [Acinetobacter sp. ANC 3832]OTG89002.1 hypothetical protein B9T35_16895 [Acinetobacter sp. ANC 3832]